MKIRELRALLTVAEELHFSRAAERLGMAQPQLSELIRRIEDEVGFSIFHRRPRVTVTSAGEIILATARRALAELARGTEEGRAIAAGLTGRIELGFVPVAMASDLPEVLRSFAQAHPGIELRLVEGTTNALRDLVRRSRMDLALTRDGVREEGMHSLRFARDFMNVLLAEDHPLARQTTIEPLALAEEEFTLFPRSSGPEYHDRITAWCRDAGFELNVTRETESWLAAAAMVGAGMGISLGTQILSRIDLPGLVYRPIAGKPHDVSFFLSWIDGLSPAAEMFLNHVRRTRSA